MYGVTVTVAPAAEPISRADAKVHCEIASGDTSFDTYIDALIAAAREAYEQRTHRALINRTLAFPLDKFPSGNDPIYLPWSPISSVTSVTYTDADGATQTWASTNYTLQKNTEPGRIVLSYNKTWPTIRVQNQGITITYVAGHGATSANVPAHAIHAIRLLIRHWFENRSAVNIGNIVNAIPSSLDMLFNLGMVGDDFTKYGVDMFAPA